MMVREGVKDMNRFLTTSIFLFGGISVSFGAEIGAVGTYNYPSNLPANSYYPVYPSYPVYRRHVEGKLYTAKDYWEAKRKAFSEGNRKGVGSAQEHGLEKVREARTERYERDVQRAKDVLGTGSTRSDTSNSTDNSLSGSTNTALVATDEALSSLSSQQKSEPAGVIPGSILAGDGSFKRVNIAKILTNQIGVAYSSHGERPEDGVFSCGTYKICCPSHWYCARRNQSRF